MTAHDPRGRAWRLPCLFLAASLAGRPLGAQPVSPSPLRPDSAARDSAAVRPLERVLVRALRAGESAPIAQTTVGRETVARRSFGQELPLLLQGAVPSLTAHAESGSNWGYSYLRLRGLDQSRINLSLDGIPLNDPEDHVFFFANLADLAASVQSVQVQRGVGTTGTGTAAFAGSINFETRPVGAMPRGASAELQGGSFGARRLLIEGRTGLIGGRVAAQARLSGLRTNGVREHAGVQGRSGMASAAWIGARDVIKATVLAGLLEDTLSYLAAPIDELRRNRRANPLTPQETDRFGQQLVSLAHTRQATAHVQLATTLYRQSAGGGYDVAWDGALSRYRLDFTWWGVTHAVNVDRPGLRLHLGVNANRYARDHHAYALTDLATPLYFNTGHKGDAAAFAKGAWTRGRLTLFGDAQWRRARFRYEPDAAAGFTGDAPAVDWSFLNPRAGVTIAAAPGLELFGSIGRTTREPARVDLFAGADDLTRAAFDDVGGLARVRPERVVATEAGVRRRGARTRLEATLYDMRFRDEIARIGQLSPLGAELRSNVDRSRRRGVELDGGWTPRPGLTLSATATLSHNRIAEWVDASVTPARRYRDVPPLLTPAVLATHRVDWRVARRLDMAVEGRYQGVSQLRNDGDPALTLPDFYQLDAMVRVPLGRHELALRGTNLGDSRRFGSGYAVAGVPHFFILAPRSLFITVRVDR